MIAGGVSRRAVLLPVVDAERSSLVTLGVEVDGGRKIEFREIGISKR